MEERKSFAHRTTRKGSQLVYSFLGRWIFWSVLIGTPAWFVGEKLWPHVYDKWGAPMHLYQDEVYYAVLFGDAISAILGGAAVAFVGTFRRG